MDVIKSTKTILSSLLLASAIMPAQATNFEVYNNLNSGFTGTGGELASALTQGSSGITLITGNTSFQGNFDNSSIDNPFGEPNASDIVFNDNDEPIGYYLDEDDFFPVVNIGSPDSPHYEYTFPYGSASFFTNVNFGSIGETDFVLPQGILLTSGNAAPLYYNTQPGFTSTASGLGDEGLNALLNNSINGLDFDIYTTTDATALSFDFTVDAGINAISLDFIFGTDGNPAAAFPDIAAIFIDGVNYAGFTDGSLLRLTPETENFFSNDETTPLNIEYNNLSGPQTLLGLLDTSREVHTIKIAVSNVASGFTFEGFEGFDGFDGFGVNESPDSGLFIANLQGLALAGPGEKNSGETSTSPLLPTSEEAGSFEFVINIGGAGLGIDPTEPLFIDPYVATGYDYEVFGSTFTSVQVPDYWGDGLYNLYYWNGTEYVSTKEVLTAGGPSFNLLDIDPAGFSKIRIDGIEIGAGLDPNDPTAFVTGLTFSSGGLFRLTQTAIQECDGSADCSTAAIPEPSIFLLFGTGLLGMLYMKRRKISQKA